MANYKTKTSLYCFVAQTVCPQNIRGIYKARAFEVTKFLTCSEMKNK